MTEPSDTDRIIAAQAEQGHKTRVLLVWIFIGIPLAGWIVWSIVTGITSHTPSQIPGGDPIVQTTTTDYSALLTTIDYSTLCSAVSSQATDAAVDAYTGGYAHDRIAFLSECALHPTELAGPALATVRAQSAH